MLPARQSPQRMLLSTFFIYFAGHTHVHLLFTEQFHMEGDQYRSSKNNSWKWREPILGY